MLGKPRGISIAPIGSVGTNGDFSKCEPYKITFTETAMKLRRKMRTKDGIPGADQLRQGYANKVKKSLAKKKSAKKARKKNRK